MSDEDRSARFNATTGALGYSSAHGPTPASLHPDRCVCQQNDPIPHKHYQETPFRCARCSNCRGYAPALHEYRRLGRMVYEAATREATGHE